MAGLVGPETVAVVLHQPPEFFGADFVGEYTEACSAVPEHNEINLQARCDW